MVFLYSYVRRLVQITHKKSEEIIEQKSNNKGMCNYNRTPQNDQWMTLTYKLRSTKDVFEIVAKIDLVGQAKVNELNAWMRHAPVQQHDVLWLRERDRNKERERLLIYCTEKSKREADCTRKQEIGHNTWKSHAKL